MHFMDITPNLYSTFMCKYANTFTYVQICAKYVLRFYAAVILQMYKYGRRALIQQSYRVI